MAIGYQGLIIRGINKDAKYKVKYTLKQTTTMSGTKYTYSKTITPTKKYSYAT